MLTRDTSKRAAAVQAELHARLGPERRFRMAMEISEFAREFAKAGLRAEHPEFSDDELLRELTVRMHRRPVSTK